MLTKWFKAPSKEDICPNCGTACLATDVLCPNCGGNLDELFEQLPDPKETNELFKIVSKNLPFMRWLAPLLLLLSPVFVSVITILRGGLNMGIDLGQSFFQMFWGDVVYSAFVSSGLLIIGIIPLFLCTTSVVRAKIGQRRVVIWGTVFSILSAIILYLALLTAYMISAIRFQIGFGIPTPAAWVYFVIAGGMILIVLYWITAIQQENTA